MSLIDEIKEKRKELEYLEEQYLKETPRCENKDCAFYKERSTGNCSWSIFLEDCKDYFN